LKLRWWHYEYYKKTWQEKSNDTNKDHKQLIEWVTWVIQRYRVILVFRLLMWPTKIIIGDPILCCWTNLVEIFPVVLVVSWSKFQCVSEIFFFFSFFSRNFTIWEGHKWNLGLTNHKYHLRFSKLYYFLKYFLYHVTLLIMFLTMLKTWKKTRNATIANHAPDKLIFKLPCAICDAWRRHDPNQWRHKHPHH